MQVDETEQGRVTLGLSVILRVTLRDGTYHEVCSLGSGPRRKLTEMKDIGYGHIENCKGKAAAFEKAKKEGTTDALKRALRNFGDLLGNCVYDKEYLAKVTKLKPGPTRFDPDNLHRHHEFEPVRKERGREPAKTQVGVPLVKREALAETEDTQATIKGFGEDEFGSDDFDAVDFAVSEGDHPDEIMLDASLASGHHNGKHDSLRKQNASEVLTREPGNIPRLPSPCSKIKEPQTPRQEESFEGHRHHSQILLTLPHPTQLHPTKTIKTPRFHPKVFYRPSTPPTYKATNHQPASSQLEPLHPSKQVPTHPSKRPSSILISKVPQFVRQ